MDEIASYSPGRGGKHVRMSGSLGRSLHLRLIVQHKHATNLQQFEVKLHVISASRNTIVGDTKSRLYEIYQVEYIKRFGKYTPT